VKTWRASVVALALASLGGCDQPAPPRAPAPAPAPAAPPSPPAKMAKMVCRNSQTGAKAECGTPNAVMVGVAPE